MRWVLLDLNGCLWRASHSIGGSLSYGGDPTGIIFGFFEQLRAIMVDPHVRSNRVAIFRDSSHSFRRENYAPYKAKRRENRTPEEKAQRKLVHSQGFLLAKGILPALGLPVYQQKGLESDDLIARAAWIVEKLFREKAVIVSSDGDLWQCIRDDIHWYDPQRGTYFTPESFKEKKGIDSFMWGNVKCLAGCKSDNVAGIPGVGEKTAVRFLNGELPAGSKALERIREGRKKWIDNRNRELVVLPHAKTKRLKLKNPEWNPKAFWKMCDKFGFDSFKTEKKAWESLMSGRVFSTRKREKSK